MDEEADGPEVDGKEGYMLRRRWTCRAGDKEARRMHCAIDKEARLH